MSSAYPAWVCYDCAKQVSARFPSMATWHEATCDICGQRKTVTEPRDFGYPDFRPVIERLSREAPPRKARA